MNRRALLASIGGSSVAFAGCLDGASEGIGDRAPDGDGNSSPGTGGDETDGLSGTNESDRIDGNSSKAWVPEPDGNCGSDADPLSSALLDRVDQNEGVCQEGLTPSFALANDREDALTAAVEITSEEEPIFEGSYSLEAGERAIEQNAGAAGDLESVTVVLEGGGELSGEWTGTACYRHAAVLTDDGIDVGYVRPVSGPGDTQHDCYAGDPIPIRVFNDGSAWTATITVVDHCRELIEEDTLSLEAGEGERLEDALTNGGRYDVAVEVENGGVAAEEFRDVCWGLSVSIDGEGDPEIGPLEMD